MLQALISPGYESEMTEIVGMWINTGLIEYNTKHNQNWKGKDSAISIRIFLVVNPVGCSEDIFRCNNKELRYHRKSCVGDRYDWKPV
jgi:hypothetical protein